MEHTCYDLLIFILTLFRERSLWIHLLKLQKMVSIKNKLI